MQNILRMIKAAQATTGTVAERMQALSTQFENALPRELADVLNEVGAISDAELAHIEEHGFDFFPEETIVRQLVDVAAECKRVIDRAERAGVTIDDGNVIDLLADNIVDVSLADLRAALVCSGHGPRFPRATSKR